MSTELNFHDLVKKVLFPIENRFWMEKVLFSIQQEWGITALGADWYTLFMKKFQVNYQNSTWSSFATDSKCTGIRLSKAEKVMHMIYLAEMSTDQD